MSVCTALTEFDDNSDAVGSFGPRLMMIKVGATVPVKTIVNRQPSHRTFNW